MPLNFCGNPKAKAKHEKLRANTSFRFDKEEAAKIKALRKRREHNKRRQSIAELMSAQQDAAEMDQMWAARRGCYLAAGKYREMKGDSVYLSDTCVPISKLCSRCF